MGKQHDPEVRQQCKLAYCIERRSIPEIETRFGVGRNTLYRWRKQDDWEKMRQARVMSGPLMAAKLRQQIVNVIDAAEREGRDLTPGETDKIYKLQLMVDKNDKGARFEAHVIDAMDLLNNYLGDHDTGLRDQLSGHIIPFLNYVLRRPSVS